jgi:hypothetical protein
MNLEGKKSRTDDIEENQIIQVGCFVTVTTCLWRNEAESFFFSSLLSPSLLWVPSWSGLGLLCLLARG